MRVRVMNCFTCGAYYPRHLQTGVTVLLIESGFGLMLIDAGVGEQDYVTRPLAMKKMQLVTRMPMDPEETAVRQAAGLGYSHKDVTDIVLTHMHFDHSGGMADFPGARVHVSRAELEAFNNPGRHWLEQGYERRHLDHGPLFELYDEPDGEWRGFQVMRLRVESEIYLVPLPGHTAGHCGVLLKMESGWWLHTGDAATASFDDSLPTLITRSVLGPHVRRLAEFRDANPDVRMTSGHILLSDDIFNRWFE